MPGDDPGGVVDRVSFGEALTRLRAGCGLSLRVLARRTGLPLSTLGDWSGGRSLPQRGQTDAFREVLTACEVPPAEHGAWLDALERARFTPPRRDVVPYRGLLAYETADSAWFFGREQLTGRVVERVAAVAAATGPRVVAVVGPSGSGKSSVLRAGVVTAVGVEGVPGSDLPWATELMTPGDDPLGAFAARPSAPGHPPGPDDGPAPLATLLVVDQFEELFAAAVDDLARARFLDALFDLAGSPTSRTVVALGMRADFYGVAVSDPRLARVLQDEQVVVAPMDEAELRAAVVEPARHAEREVDPELVERLLREMGVTSAGDTHDVGALPLLSHALRATWERATGRRLTTADYEASGGLAGAVEQTAEDVHRGLDPAGREVARRLFTRLVRLDEATGTLTRRTLTRDAVPGADPVTTAAVVDAFVERRLLTADDGTVTISHERLLTAWPRLGEWLEADRDALRTHHQLADAVRDWQASGRDPSYLLTGTRLAAAAELAADDEAALAPAERDLVAASVDAGDADRRRQRRRLRRTRQLLALVAVLLAVTSTASVFAVRSRSAAEDARRRAETAGRQSLARQVAVEARQLQARDPALAQQLAAAAWRTAPLPEARSALLDLAAAGVVTRVLGGDGPTTLALAPDGRTLAVGHGDDGSVHLFTLRSGAAPAPFAVVPGRAGSQVFALAWHGSVLAIGGTTGEVTLWAVVDGRAVRRAGLDHPFERAVEGLAFSPDGRSLAAVSDGDEPVRVWDVADPAAPRYVGAPPGVPAGTTEQAVTFSPDGTRLVTAGTGGTLFAWPTAGLPGSPPTVVPSASGATVYVLRYDPAGRGLHVGDRDGVVTVRDPGSLAVTATHDLSSTAWVNTLAFSPDGSEVAVGTSDGAVDRLATDSWTARATSGNPGPVTGLAYTPDGASLISAAADGTTRIAPTGGVTVGTGLNVFSVAFPAAGDTVAVATSGPGATAQLWAATGDGGSRPLGAAWQVPDLTGTAAARADGQVIATGSRDGSVRLWDVRDPARPEQLGAAFAGATALVEILAFSPDGRTLAVGSDDNTLRLWDVSNPAAPRALGVMTAGNYVVGTAFSPDGRRVAAASVDNSAYVYDVTAPARPALQTRLGGFTNYVWGVAFSPDGRLLAAASADRTTRLWDVSGGTPRLRTVVSGPKGYDIAAAFSPDSRTLAVASHDGNVWLYDVGTSAPRTLATLTAVGGVVNAVSFSPDGRHLVAGGRSTTVPVWDTDPDAVVARICAAGGDRITRQEWSDYVPGAAYDPPCG